MHNPVHWLKLPCILCILSTVYPQNPPTTMCFEEQWKTKQAIVLRACVTHSDSVRSKDWTMGICTLYPISKLLTTFSQHILPIIWRQGCSNTKSLFTFALDGKFRSRILAPTILLMCIFDICSLIGWNADTTDTSKLQMSIGSYKRQYTSSDTTTRRDTITQVTN